MDFEGLEIQQFRLEIIENINVRKNNVFIDFKNHAGEKFLFVDDKYYDIVENNSILKLTSGSYTIEIYFYDPAKNEIFYDIVEIDVPSQSSLSFLSLILLIFFVSIIFTFIIIKRKSR